MNKRELGRSSSWTSDNTAALELLWNLTHFNGLRLRESQQPSPAVSNPAAGFLQNELSFFSWNPFKLLSSQLACSLPRVKAPNFITVRHSAADGIAEYIKKKERWKTTSNFHLAALRCRQLIFSHRSVPVVSLHTKHIQLRQLRHMHLSWALPSGDDVKHQLSLTPRSEKSVYVTSMTDSSV